MIPLTILVLAVVAGVVFMTPRAENAPQDDPMAVQEASQMTEESETASPEAMTEAMSYTMADVEANATEESCYTAVDGKVYDLTAWIEKHPGGAANILRICGIDGTTAFTGKHGGNAQAMAQIENYYIGELAQ